MGLGMQVVTGRVTNVGATLTAVTVATGDSLTVRSFPFESAAYLLNHWQHGASATTARIRSPRLHDNVQGIRTQCPAAEPRPRMPLAQMQRLYSQDTLVVEESGGAAETDLVSLLLYYRDLPGVNARLASWEEIAPRIVNYLTAEQALTTGGTAGDYGGEQTIVADFDLLKANVDYAILGATVSASIGTVGIRGPDTGNLRVGVPGIVDADENRDFFVRLNRQTGLPTIPVMNAANSGSTLVDLVDDDAATARTVEIILAELA